MTTELPNNFPSIHRLDAQAHKENAHLLGKLIIYDCGEYDRTRSDGLFAEFGLTHWVEFRDTVTGWHVVYNYCPQYTERPNPWRPEKIMITHKGWSCGCS